MLLLFHLIDWTKNEGWPNDFRNNFYLIRFYEKCGLRSILNPFEYQKSESCKLGNIWLYFNLKPKIKRKLKSTYTTPWVTIMVRMWFYTRFVFQTFFFHVLDFLGFIIRYFSSRCVKFNLKNHQPEILFGFLSIA